MALFWRIWTAVVLVNVVVLTLFVGLATLQFDSINSGLVGERLAVLAGRTAQPFQAAAKIGLPLSTVRNAKALLERARQTDPAIAAVHVFDAAGRIAHSTVSPIPAEILPEAAAARDAAGGHPWHAESDAGFFSGIDIARPDGSSAGGIVIVYPKGGSATQVRAMAAELAISAIGVVALAAGLAVVLLWVGLRGPVRMFEVVDSAISDFERGAWRSAAAGTAAPAPQAENGGELRRLLGESEARYRAVGQAVSGVGEGRA